MGKYKKGLVYGFLYNMSLAIKVFSGKWLSRRVIKVTYKAIRRHKARVSFFEGYARDTEELQEILVRNKGKTICH